MRNMRRTVEGYQLRLTKRAHGRVRLVHERACRAAWIQLDAVVMVHIFLLIFVVVDVIFILFVLLILLVLLRLRKGTSITTEVFSQLNCHWLRR